MKRLYALVAMFALVSGTAFAGQGNDRKAELENQVLALLISSSASIQLVDGDSKPVPQDQQLPALFAEALIENYLGLYVPGAKLTVLSATSVDCINVTPDKIVGAQTFSCQVAIGNGDFEVVKDSKKKDGSLVGPKLESSTNFRVEVIRPIVPNPKLSLKSLIIPVEHAG